MVDSIIVSYVTTAIEMYSVLDLKFKLRRKDPCKKNLFAKECTKKLLICFASVDASVVQLGGGTRQAPGRGAGSCIVNTSNTRPDHWRSSDMF